MSKFCKDFECWQRKLPLYYHVRDSPLWHIANAFKTAVWLWLSTQNSTHGRNLRYQSWASAFTFSSQHAATMLCRSSRCPGGAWRWGFFILWLVIHVCFSHSGCWWAVQLRARLKTPNHATTDGVQVQCRASNRRPVGARVIQMALCL